MAVKLNKPVTLYAPGKRARMEDYIVPAHESARENDRIFMVCDGMGGHMRGDVASKIVCNSLLTYFNQNIPQFISNDYFLSAFDHAQSQIDQYINIHPYAKGMGTTLILLYLHNNQAVVVQCGDSRFYHIRKGEILFQTTDHKLVEELLKMGVISPEEIKTHPKKNVITRALQGKTVSNPTPDIYFINDILAGDYMFLCSDGVCDGISDTQLTSIISSDMEDEEKMSRINDFCEQNSNDNYSAILINVKAIEN